MITIELLNDILPISYKQQERYQILGMLNTLIDSPLFKDEYFFYNFSEITDGFLPDSGIEPIRILLNKILKTKGLSPIETDDEFTVRYTKYRRIKIKSKKKN